MTQFTATHQTKAERVACDHCGLPVPRGLIEPEADHQFCCQGCRTVYEILHANEMEEFYRVRDAVDAESVPARVTSGSYDNLDSPELQAKICQGLAGGLLSVDLRLDGVHCAACMWLIERLPKFVGGVVTARLNLRDAIVRVVWDPTQTSLSRIATALDRLGYAPQPAREVSATEFRRRGERMQLVRLGIAGACAGNTMLIAVALYAGDYLGMQQQFEHLFRLLSAAIGLVALLWPGGVFFRGAWASLRSRTPTLDLPIALALGVGGAVGTWNAVTGRGEIYFDSLSVLVFLLLVGRWFQARQQRWADEAVGLLQQFTPATCRVAKGDNAVDVPIESLTAGDIVEVLSGAIIPADGEVSSGSSAVNRSLLTGESRPEPVVPGDLVFAGTQNMGAAIRFTVSTIGEETRLGRLMELVEQGIREKPPAVQLADRAAGWFVAVVVVIATSTFVAWATTTGLETAIEHAVALLIVACPCALGLATPLTFAVAIGAAARHQTLIKNAGAIEALARRGRMLLDKTGTITTGTPSVIEWIGPSDLQAIVARLESHSSHPIAAALVDAYGDREPPESAPLLDQVQEHTAGGIEAAFGRQRLFVGSPSFVSRMEVSMPDAWQRAIADREALGQTVVVVALDDAAHALIALGDQVRPGAAEAIAWLDAHGWQPAIASGDAQGVVDDVAQQVGIPAERAQGVTSPEEKLALVSRRDDDRATSVMVGDGVNDAGALAAADVGIAVAGGTEVSLAAADIYVSAPGIAPLVGLVKLARRTMRVIRRNLVIAVSYNALAVTLAALGYITPLVAAILMPISSATVLASAMSVSLAEPD